MVFGFDHAHPSPPATLGRFEHNWIAHCTPQFDRFLEVSHRGGRAVQDRYAHFFGDFASCDFIAEHLECFDARTDEHDPFCTKSSRKLGILREESISRVNGIDLVFAAQANDSFDVQIRSDRLPRLADRVRFVRFESMQCKSIFVRVNSDGSNR